MQNIFFSFTLVFVLICENCLNWNWRICFIFVEAGKPNHRLFSTWTSRHEISLILFPCSLSWFIGRFTICFRNCGIRTGWHFNRLFLSWIGVWKKGGILLRLGNFDRLFFCCLGVFRRLKRKRRRFWWIRWRWIRIVTGAKHLFELYYYNSQKYQQRLFTNDW